MNRPHLPAAERALVATVAAIAASATLTPPVAGAATVGLNVRMTQPSRPSRLHFVGNVHLEVPAGWHPKRPWSVGSAVFDVTLAGSCVAAVYVDSASAITGRSARAQLHTEVPKAAQPGLPVPHTVRLLGQGPLRGAGWWEAVTPQPKPSREQGGFPLFGAALIGIGHDEWAGATIGVSPGLSCASPFPGEPAIASSLEGILRSITLRGVRATPRR
jgi:hypothetical protein